MVERLTNRLFEYVLIFIVKLGDKRTVVVRCAFAIVVRLVGWGLV